MSNAIVQHPYEFSTTATVYGIDAAVRLFTAMQHQGWSVTLHTPGDATVAYTVTAECQDYVMRMVANEVNVPTEI